MMITNLARAFLKLTALFGASFLMAVPVLAAPRYTFDPANVTIPNGQSVTVSVLIDAETQQVFGGDAVMLYPTSDVEIVSVTNGGYFNEVFNYANSVATGKLEVHSFYSSSYTTRTGSGTFAVVTLRAKKDTGGGSVTFHCTGDDSSSHILKSDLTNIISCASVNQLAMAYTGTGSSPTPTSTGSPTVTLTPTTGPNETPTPTPTKSTAPGQKPSCNFLAVDTNTGAAPLTVSLICAGSDPEDDVWAAEFDFGNGQKHEFVKNVGKSGSFTVVYVYGKGGIYTPSCRVRDINNQYSEAHDSCKRKINVTGDSGGTGGTDVGGIKPTPTPSKKVTPTPPSRISPTPQDAELVQFVESTPTPLALESKKPTKPYDLPRVFIGLSIIVVTLLVGGLLIYKNRDGVNPPNIPISQD